MSDEIPVRVEVRFPISAGAVPIDHGYLLFSALSSVLGDLHGASWLAVHPLRGTPLPGAMLAVKRNAQALRLRVVPVELPRVLGLAGKTLDVGGCALRLGKSNLHPIKPFASLGARIVVLKGFTEARVFGQALRRQLDDLHVACSVEVRSRRIVSIEGSRIVGFATQLHGLEQAASLRVQYAGIGGRQRMGCGGFVPLRRTRVA